MIYLVGCKLFLVVTDHLAFIDLLKQPNDKLTYHRQVHCIEPLMSFAQGTGILNY